MFWTYALQSESSGRYYIGSTSDLKRRLQEHNGNLAAASKNRGPWRLVYEEAYATRGEAMKRERYLKTGKGREELKRQTEPSR